MPRFRPTIDSPVKPVMRGLVDRQAVEGLVYNGVATDWENRISGIVAKLYWSDLQPTEGGALVIPAAVASALADADTYGWQVKLRIYAGIHSPEWVMDAFGTRVHVISDVDVDDNGDVPRFWEAGFTSGPYADFMALVAEEWDDDERVCEVMVSNAGTIFAEPMIRHIGNATTKANLWTGGLRRANDMTAYRDGIDVHSELFRRTRSGFSFNRHQFLESSTVAGTASFTDAIEIMDYGREQMGERFVVENNSYLLPEKDNNLEIYDAMDPPMTLQTETQAAIEADYGGWAGTVTDAGANVLGTLTPTGAGSELYDVCRGAIAIRGAEAIEVPNDYETNMTITQANNLNAALNGGFALVP